MPESLYRRARVQLQYLSFIVAAIATLLYVFTSFRDLEETRGKSLNAMVQMDRAIQRLDAQKKDLEMANQRNEALIRQLQDLSAKNAGGGLNQSQITTLAENLSSAQAQLSSLKSSVDLLNQAIGSSPDKVIALPLLKQQMDDFKALTQRDVDSVRSEMARNYDLNKWLIGLILAAVLGTVVNNTLQARAPKAERQQRESE